MDPRQRFAIVSALTHYDERAARRKGHNPYAIALYLQSLDRAEEEMASGVSLRTALTHSFCGRLLEVVGKAVSIEYTEAEIRR